VAYKIYIILYFKSEKFNAIKNSIKQYTKNCNDLNDHIENLKSSYSDIRSFDYGERQLYDDSNYNMKRRKWGEETKNNRTHNCSASVCKNAGNQPFKFANISILKSMKKLCRYLKKC
jgi:hypothetical protein